MTPDRHSRSRVAGYDPERLFSTTVLVVGAGALGQNLLLDLGLSGIGRVIVVDHDQCEDQNRTRSPLYPSPQTIAVVGNDKAPCVAVELLDKMTAPDPLVEFANAFIQDVGDELIDSASVVFCAVDNARARAYIADRCRLLGRPMVEGGFHAEELTCGVFAPTPSSPCYRCISPDLDGVASCASLGRTAETQQVVPALQNGAAVLGALMAEQGIGLLHGRDDLTSKRLFLDIRSLRSNVISVSTNPECAGVHHQVGPPAELAARPTTSVQELLDEIHHRFGPADVRPPFQIVGRLPCTSCGCLCEAWVPDWRWLQDSRCAPCGGPHRRADEAELPLTPVWLSTEGNPDLVELDCTDIGLHSRSAVEVHPRAGPPHLARLAAGPGCTTPVHPPKAA